MKKTNETVEILKAKSLQCLFKNPSSARQAVKPGQGKGGERVYTEIEALVQGVRKKDMLACTQMVRCYAPLLLNSVKRAVGDAALAESLVHTILNHAIALLQAGAPVPALKPWLGRVASLDVNALLAARTTPCTDPNGLNMWQGVQAGSKEQIAQLLQLLRVAMQPMLSEKAVGCGKTLQPVAFENAVSLVELGAMPADLESWAVRVARNNLALFKQKDTAATPYTGHSAVPAQPQPAYPRSTPAQDERLNTLLSEIKATKHSKQAAATPPAPADGFTWRKQPQPRPQQAAQAEPDTVFIPAGQPLPFAQPGAVEQPAALPRKRKAWAAGLSFPKVSLAQIASGLVTAVLVFGIMVLLWALLGLMIKTTGLPRLDLGYNWFNKNVFYLF